MKKVVSFCLWGKNPKYTIGAIKNAQLCVGIYPKWERRFYVADSVPSNIISGLISLKCTVVDMGKGDWTSMFWRFLPAFEKDITMISRDTDSRISSRERLAVDHWIESDKDFHIMRDHRCHDIEILGGMWGCRKNILREMKKEMLGYEGRDEWGTDQYFLRDFAWPLVKDRSLVHDDWSRYDGGEKRSFPSERVNGEYVGSPFSAEDSLEVPFK